MCFSTRFLGVRVLTGMVVIKSTLVASLTNVIIGFTEHLMHNSQCIHAWLQNLPDSVVSILLELV